MAASNPPSPVYLPAADVAERLFGVDMWDTPCEILNAVFTPRSRVAVKACHASSKALALDTPIATPDGWTTMGDVAVGDQVYDEQGRIVRVTSVSPIMEKPCYRVTFCTGETITASDDHLWATIDLHHRPRNITDWRLQWGRAVNVTTEQMAAAPKVGEQHRWRIPTCGALVGGQDWPLATPPYTFGAWLGDGSASRAEITCGEEDLAHMLAMVGGRVERPANRAPRIWFSDRPYLECPGRESGGKRIPDAVLRSSVPHRWAVLQGLMDTDGWATRGAGVSIGQTRLDLARDIYDLVVSLGYKASVREQRAVLDGRDCGPCYVVSFSPDVCPFTLPRKAEKWQRTAKQASRFTQRTIVDIAPVGVLPTRCIGVDSPRHLYLAGRGLIPTHNTHTAAIAVALTLYEGGDVLTTAPTWEQVKTVLWGEVHRLLAGSVIPLSEWGTINQTEIVMPDGSHALGLSTNEGVRFQGWHARPGSFLLLIADEAPGVRPDIFEAWEGISAGGDVRHLLLGNPVISSGYFYDIFAGANPVWRRFTIDAFNTPNLRGLSLADLLDLPDADLDVSPRPYLVDRRWVRDRYREWGEDHPLWQSRVRGQFPLQADDALLSLSWLEAAATRPGVYDPYLSVQAGIDVAGPGDDETVLCIRQGDAILELTAWSQADARGPVLAALRPWRQRGLDAVNVDVAGLGHYFALALEDADLPVVRVNVGEAPTDDKAKETFKNLRAQAFWSFREWAAEGMLAGLTDRTALAQLAGIRYLHDSRGRIEIEKKDDARKRGVKSPDRAEAVVLAFWNAPRKLIGAAIGRAMSGGSQTPTVRERLAEKRAARLATASVRRGWR